MRLSTALAIAPILPAYAQLRAVYPHVPARLVHQYLRDDEGLTFEQFVCAHTGKGHQWACSGSAYGGDDDSYHGEGRSYCCHCGADGDA